MTELRERLDNSLQKGQRAKDTCAVSTLRLILAAIKDRDIAERGQGNADGVDDTQILALLQAMIKQREESIRLYEQGKRPDLVEQEANEIAVIRTFLPPPLSEEETAAAISAIIEETGAASLKDMGRVMAALKERYAGQLDLASVGKKVRKRLT
jgi:uncharacterized protein